MAENVRDGAAAACPSSKSRSGCELLEEIKSHDIMYRTPVGGARSFTQRLNVLRQEERFTDVTVCVKDEKYPCHKVVLAASSEYFRALFDYDMEDSTTTGGANNTITLNGVAPNGFQALLQYMYTQEMTIDTENILDVLEAADFLQFRPIVEKCASMLLQHMSPTNCLALHQIGESHLCNALAEASYGFIIRNFGTICKTKEFLRLGIESLLRYLVDEYLQVGHEAALFEAVCCWIDFDFEERKKFVMELVAQVDLPNINRDILHEITSMNENIKELFKDIVKEYNSEMTENFIQQKSALKKRASEVLVVVPKETTASATGKRKKNIYYCFTKDPKWKTLTEIPFSDRVAYDVAVLGNGMFFTGGSEYNVALNDVTSYSVTSDLWEKQPPMIKSRLHHGSASLGGKLYVVGGRNQEETMWESRTITLRNDAEVYDQKLRQWTLIEPPVGTPGIGRPAVVPLDGKLYVIGGTTGTGESQPKKGGPTQRTTQSCARCYEVDRKEWLDLDISDSMDSMKIAVGIGDCIAHEGCILLIDEDLRGKRMAVYNPISGKLSSFIHTHGTHRFGGYAIQRNTLYLTGGVAGIFKTHDLVHYQDLTQPEGVWGLLPPLPDALSHHACLNVFKQC